MEKKEASVGALSYFQAKLSAIQYSTELIWNKSHLRTEEDNLFLLPLSSFLHQHSNSHCQFCSIWTSPDWKMQCPVDGSAVQVLGDSLGVDGM